MAYAGSAAVGSIFMRKFCSEFSAGKKDTPTPPHPLHPTDTQIDMEVCKNAQVKCSDNSEDEEEQEDEAKKSPAFLTDCFIFMMVMMMKMVMVVVVNGTDDDYSGGG